MARIFKNKFNGGPMDSFNSESGRKVAEAIDHRVMNVAKNIYENSPNNKTKFGTVLSSNMGLFSVKIDNLEYTNIPALRNVGSIKRGEVVICLIPNNQYSNMIILGVADGTIQSIGDDYIPKTGGIVSGTLQSTSLTTPILADFEGDSIISQNTKPEYEFGNIATSLRIRGRSPRPVYDSPDNTEPLALLSDCYLKGEVISYAGTTTPNGWLICDGSAISRTSYAALFSVIGTTYGEGDGTTTFNLPNLIDKFIQGSNTAGTEKTAGLPNITAQYNAIVTRNDSFSGTGAGSGSTKGSTTRQYKLGESYTFNTNSILDFNANNSNNIYGNSATVQPPALTMRYIIKY